MPVRELVQDRYEKTQQVASVVDKYIIPPRYGHLDISGITAKESSVPVVLSGSAYATAFGQEWAEEEYGADISWPGSVNATAFGQVWAEGEYGVYISWPGSANAIAFRQEQKEYPEINFVRPGWGYPTIWYQIPNEVEVYTGYRVSFTEYERRFKDVDLDYFRKVLPPELFKAYVHTMGSIEGLGIKPEDRFKGKD